MAQWFDPEAIRSDVEGSLFLAFNPASYSSLTAYAIGDRARVSSNVYVALAAATGVSPPSAQWELEGPTYSLIYDGVAATIPAEGAIKLQISWGLTTDMTIPCRSGAVRSVQGVLTAWVYTPPNKGTKQGLLAAARLRKLFGLWGNNGLGLCGQQVKMHNPNGPRTIAPAAGVEYQAHVLTCSLTALETVGGF